MRISTQYLFESGGARISDLQSSLVKTQQQIATGTRILTPADDPVAAARALEVTQSQSINTQLSRNRQTAMTALTAEDSTLASVTNLLQSVQDTVTSAGNGTLSDVNRASLATTLQANLDQLVGLANTTDAQGNYVFSGYQSNTRAFVQTATGATYQGDSGQQLLQVDASRQMAIGNTGQSVFQGGGQDVFQTIKSLVTLLQTPGAPAPATLATLSSSLNQSLNNVLTVRSSVGSRLNELDALNASGSDRDLQYSQTLSSLQDLDYAKAVTQLTQQQTTLQAAQQSFVKISGLSLFNYL
jgi:flagellar hook-associated protein 3 FlgL